MKQTLSWKSELKAWALNQKSMESSGLQGNFMKPPQITCKVHARAFSWEEGPTFHQSFKGICDLQKVKYSRKKAKTSKCDYKSESF